MVQGKIIFEGKVLDNDDPLRLGRLRVLPKIELLDDNKESIPIGCRDITDVETGVKQICKWKENDPFVILPLLPFYTKITPKKGELVYIFYPYVQDPSSQSRYLSDRNRFYLPTTPSTPLSVIFESETQTKTNSLGGENYKAQNFLTVGGQIPKEIFGVFPEPDDVSIIGRGTADLILQQDRALLRAGKTNDLVGPTTTGATSNEKRAFLDLARFTTTKTKGEQTSQTRIITDVQKLILLIEYDIINPENQADSFTGNIYLYNINKKGLPETVNSKDFKVDTDVENWKGAQLPVSISFKSKSSVEVVKLINEYIRGLNNGLINPLEYSFADIFTTITIPFRPEPGKQFPFAYRPHPNFYNKMVDAAGGPVESNNLYSIYQKVGLIEGSNSFGFGIVSAKDTLGPLLKIKTEKVTPIIDSNQNITIGSLGAQKLYLLSHDTQIGDLKINLKDTIYGISPDVYLDIESKTEPLIRGEKMMDLIELIVKFLLSHVHPYHGLAAVPVGQDGTQSAQILQKLLDAPNTILNQQIRIN